MILMYSKIFLSLMRQNDTKFCQDQKVEFKKAFKLYCHHSVQISKNLDSSCENAGERQKILARVLIEVGNCDAHAEQNISFINETKRCQILPRLKY